MIGLEDMEQRAFHRIGITGASFRQAVNARMNRGAHEKFHSAEWNR